MGRASRLNPTSQHAKAGLITKAVKLTPAARRDQQQLKRPLSKVLDLPTRKPQ